MAKYIEWSDTLSVGIQEIDEQHKVLVDIINELHDAVHQRKGHEACGHILNELGEYTRIHFAVEESLMRLLHYPAYEQHKAEHEALISDLSQFLERFKAGEGLTFELMNFLRQWLTKHIMESDMEYTDHFLSKGVEAKWKKKGLFGKLWGSIRS
jgi:hemerythrin